MKSRKEHIEIRDESIMQIIIKFWTFFSDAFVLFDYLTELLHF